jgi:peptide/nickel transport system substrate-binding protein
VSADRLTYSFTLEPRWRFSNGQKVTGTAFARAFQRARSSVLASPAEPYLREVASWKADGLHLTIRLKQVAPDFLQRLALPYFCAVPPSTPDSQTDNLPTAGPYEIASYQPGDSLLLRRNPYYGGSRPGRIEQIDYRFGDFPSQIRLELSRGQTDYAVLPTTLFSDVAANLRGSARDLVVAQVPTVAYLALNTQRPLFRNNPQLRRAVNYALDRPFLARQFGYRGAQPADQYLPPGFPGYQAAQLYPLDGPDVAKARRLARGHLRGGSLVYLSCGTVACKQRAEIVASDLGRIGLHVQIESAPGSGTQTLATVAGTKFDIADVITRPDYGDPYALVDKLLDGRTIRSVGNTNISYFSDPRFDSEIDAAQRLTGLARDRAYGRLGVEIARTEAPLAAYAVLNARIFLSKRVGCVRYQPVFGLDLAALCLHPQAVR